MGNNGVSVIKRLRTYSQVAVGFAVAAVLFTSMSHSTEALQNTANTLKVSPVRSDISAKPGETQVVKTTVTNLTDAAISVHPSENDFVAGDERGTPSLILDENKFAPTHSLKRFMSPLQDITIPAKESVTIDVVIKVPTDAKAGGYFGAIRFAPSDPDSGGQVNLSASVASLILLTVPGDLTEKLNLTDFDVRQDGKANTIFNSSEGIAASFRFENKGNVQVGAFGKISVKQGDKVIYETDFNNKTPRDVVLPDSARRWEIPLEKIGGFGQYTVTATLTYGKTNQTVDVTKSFWVIPFSAIYLGIGGILLLIAITTAIWFFLRGYKRRILRSQSSHRGGYRH